MATCIYYMLVFSYVRSSHYNIHYMIYMKWMVDSSPFDLSLFIMFVDNDLPPNFRSTHMHTHTLARTHTSFNFVSTRLTIANELFTFFCFSLALLFFYLLYTHFIHFVTMSIIFRGVNFFCIQANIYFLQYNIT